VNKIARFELLSHHQQQFPHSNGINHVDSANNGDRSNGHYNSNYNGMNKNSTNTSSMHYEAHPVPKRAPVPLIKPNVNFNRSDQGFNFNYSNGNNGYSSVTNGNGCGSDNNNFYGSGVDPSPSPASLFLTDFSEQDEDSILNQYEESSNVPSPDSMSSHSISNGNGLRNCYVESRSSSRCSSSSQQRSFHQDSNSDQASIACETLLQIKRKQVSDDPFFLSKIKPSK
jgi:hypothetical protein